MLMGLTREEVVAALADRIECDLHDLAYRKTCRRQTRYDEQVTADLRAIALAICRLQEAGARGWRRGRIALLSLPGR